MNKTIKKKKNPKNKTQKKRVQRGGDPTIQELHTTLRKNIQSYIRYNTSDPAIKKIQEETNLRLTNEIGVVQRNVDLLNERIRNAKTYLDSEIERIKKDKPYDYDTDVAIATRKSTEDQKKLVEELKTTKKIIQKKTDSLLNYESYLGKATSDINTDISVNLINKNNKKLENIAKTYQSIFNIVQKYKSNTDIMNYINQKLSDVSNINIQSGLDQALQQITNKVEEKSPTLDDVLGPDESSTEEQAANDFEELSTTDKIFKDLEKKDVVNKSTITRAPFIKIDNDNIKRNKAAELIQTNVRRRQSIIKAAQIKAEQKEAARLKAEAKAVEEKAAKKAKKNADRKEKADRLKAITDAAKEAARIKAITDANKAAKLIQTNVRKRHAIKKADRLKAIADEAARKEADRLKAIADEAARKEADRLKAIADEATRLKAEADKKAAEEAARLIQTNVRKRQAIKKTAEQKAATSNATSVAKPDAKPVSTAVSTSDSNTVSNAKPVSTVVSTSDSNPVVAKPVVTTSKPRKLPPIIIFDTNGLLPPIKHEKLKSLSNEIKVLFSNRTFVYNLIEENTDNLINLINFAKYLYTDDSSKPLTTINIINIDQVLITKSFCYDPNNDTDLDDLLTNVELVDNKEWVKTFKVNISKSVKYTHYKRIL